MRASHPQRLCAHGSTTSQLSVVECISKRLFRTQPWLGSAICSTRWHGSSSCLQHEQYQAPKQAASRAYGSTKGFAQAHFTLRTSRFTRGMGRSFASHRATFPARLRTRPYTALVRSTQRAIGTRDGSTRVRTDGHSSPTRTSRGMQRRGSGSRVSIA
jgi:hypothetical protein